MKSNAKDAAAATMLVLLLGGAVFSAGCSANNEGNFELVLNVTPNPAPGTSQGNVVRWTLKVKLQNNSSETITIDGYSLRISDTDTGVTVPVVFVPYRCEIVTGRTADIPNLHIQDNRFSSGLARILYQGRFAGTMEPVESNEVLVFLTPHLIGNTP